MKTLIAYFSRGGNTAKAAKEIQKIVGGELFEIRGSKHYGNYFHALGVAHREFSQGELPEIVAEAEDFDSYDRILVGFPIWYGKAPSIVVSFLKSHNLDGKEIYPFCTSGRTGPDGAETQLKEACPMAGFHPGIRFGKVEEETVGKWLG